MKNQVLTSLFAFGFAALIGSVPAAAQTRQTATIPFAFEAGGTEYPEGVYSIERLRDLKVIKLTNLVSRRAGLVSAPVLSGSQTGQRSSLVFTGNTSGMKLNEIRFAGDPGMLIAKPGKETSAKVVVNLK